MAEIKRRITVALIGGALFQGLLIVLLLVGGSLPPEIGRTVAGLFVLSSPGYILFIRAGTVADPHPGFSSGGLILALLVNVAVYSLLVFLIYSGWRHGKSKRANHDDRSLV